MTKTPALLAATLFALIALLIANLAVAPLGPADLLGIAACACAAGASACFPLAFNIGRASTPSAPPSAPPPATVPPGPAPTASEDILATRLAERLTPELAATVTTALNSALAQAETERRAEVLRALADTPARAIDTDDLAPPSGKTRLGRGLAGLIQGTSLKASPTPPASDAPPSSATTP